MSEKTPGLGKKARIALAGLAAVGVIETGGAVVTELTNNQPMSITRTVPDDIKWPATLIENLVNKKDPDTFNDNSSKPKFGEANIIKLSPQAIIEKGLAEPKITKDSEGITLTTLLPGIFSENVPNTEIKNILNPGKPGERIPSMEKDFVMPEGYALSIPKGMHYALIKPTPEENQPNPDLVYTVVSFYNDPANNVTLILSYETTGFVPSQSQKIFERKEYNDKYNPARGGKFEDLPTSDGVTPIASPSKSGQTLLMSLAVISGKFETQLSLDSYLQINWKNMVDQNQKLILTSSK